MARLPRTAGRRDTGLFGGPARWWLAALLVLGCLWGGQEPGLGRSAQSLKNEARKLYWGAGVDQDLSRALGLYEAAAAMGDREASYIAGGMYYTGKGTAPDAAKAFRYLNLAAAQGKSTPESQRALAQFYLLGDVVPRNYTRAVRWYEDAAAAGDAPSQIELGFLYFVGRGVGQDFDKAAHWFQQAAMQNNGMAQYNMGILWYTGNGVAQSDLIRAYAWFSLAAANGFSGAGPARDYLGTVLSREEVDSAQQEASRLYDEIEARTAAERGEQGAASPP